jgi:hypothetical protein
MYFHAYQLKEEGAFRVVLKYLHHTTDPELISQEQSALGHTVRNIINIGQKNKGTAKSLLYWFRTRNQQQRNL